MNKITAVHEKFCNCTYCTFDMSIPLNEASPKQLVLLIQGKLENETEHTTLQITEVLYALLLQKKS